MSLVDACMRVGDTSPS